MGISGDGGFPVGGPECRPARYGLASVAEVVPMEGEEWTRGLEWDELACGYVLGAVSGQCPALPEQLKTATRGYGTKYADAFAIYAGWECSAGGMLLSEAWDKADALFQANRWKAIEAALWTGVDQDDNPIRSSFTMTDGEEPPALIAEDLTPAGGTVDLTTGISILEMFASGCSGCEPTIHAPRSAGPYLSERSQLERDGDMLRISSTGSRVALGSGYTLAGPTAPAAGEAWLYVSGSVKVMYGPRFFVPDRGDVAGAVDRLINDVTVFAEQFVALQLGCCLGAVRVDLASCCSAAA